MFQSLTVLGKNEDLYPFVRNLGNFIRSTFRVNCLPPQAEHRSIDGYDACAFYVCLPSQLRQLHLLALDFDATAASYPAIVVIVVIMHSTYTYVYMRVQRML